jgi:hypothetical protein
MPDKPKIRDVWGYWRCHCGHVHDWYENDADVSGQLCDE